MVGTSARSGALHVVIAGSGRRVGLVALVEDGQLNGRGTALGRVLDGLEAAGLGHGLVHGS